MNSLELNSFISAILIQISKSLSNNTRLFSKKKDCTIQKYRTKRRGE